MSGETAHQPVSLPLPLKDAGPALPAMFVRYKGWVEDELSRSMPVSEGTDPYSLLRYHLGWANADGTSAGTPVSQGKALRPTLCMFACEALDQDPVRALPAAAALELIHNFSLVHDDIQDQDLERRHQSTVWSLWGVPKALVAGNALQSVGDVTLLGTAKYGAPPDTALRVSQILTESYLEMIQGQCLDLAFEASTTITSENYLQMIAYKTGALIRSGLEIGALLATGDPGGKTFTAFSRFGNCLGRAFQVRDDFLGIWGESNLTGKPTGNDIRRRKKSFPVVLAFELATGKDFEDLCRIYGQDELDEEDVGKVLTVLDAVGAQDLSQTLTESSAGEALQALDTVELPSWARAEAEELVDFLARRQY